MQRNSEAREHLVALVFADQAVSVSTARYWKNRTGDCVTEDQTISDDVYNNMVCVVSVHQRPETSFGNLALFGSDEATGDVFLLLLLAKLTQALRR